MSTAPSLIKKMAVISFDHPHKEVILQTFNALNDDFKVRPIAGACHLLSGIMHVLLNEQGVESDLCIGEVRHPSGPVFDHSWVEIDGKVFDVAIQATYNDELHAPVFADVDLDTMRATKFNYRYQTKGLDGIAKMIFEMPFIEYLDGAPKAFGKWGGIEFIGKRIGLSLKVDELRVKYMDTKRKLIQP